MQLSSALPGESLAGLSKGVACLDERGLGGRRIVDQPSQEAECFVTSFGLVIE